MGFACFVILSCSPVFNRPSIIECAFNVPRVSIVDRDDSEALTTRVDGIRVEESVEQVLKKFKQECGR